MLKENLKEVQENILKACEKSGRNPEDVTLIAVSKTKPVPMLQEIYDENIRQVLKEKFDFSYPYAYLRELPVKVSVSELKKRKYADEEEKESYGLTDDATVLTITYQSGEEETTLKLTIGATTEDDAYYYVSMDDSDQVNTVSKESLDAVLDAISGYGM